MESRTNRSRSLGRGSDDGEIGLEKIAAEHDVDLEQAREIADAAGETCWECGRGPDEIEPIRRYVVDVDETARLCHECYADYLEETTSLSPQESDVWPLHVAGYENPDIGEKLGIHHGSPANAVRRAQEKAQDALEELRELQTTIAVVEQGSDDA